MRRRVQGPTWCRSSTCPQAAQSNRGIGRHRGNRRRDESPRCASWHTRARHCGRCVERGCVGRGTCVGHACNQTPRERSGGWRRSFGSAAVGLGLPWGRESAGLAAPCRLRSCAQAELRSRSGPVLHTSIDESLSTHRHTGHPAHWTPLTAHRTAPSASDSEGRYTVLGERLARPTPVVHASWLRVERPRDGPNNEQN